LTFFYVFKIFFTFAYRLFKFCFLFWRPLFKKFGYLINYFKKKKNFNILCVG
jgi:hypothetical protein